jgi:hypothetical protein
MSIIKQLQPLAQICSKLSVMHEQYLQPAHGMNQKIKKTQKCSVLEIPIMQISQHIKALAIKRTKQKAI